VAARSETYYNEVTLNTELLVIQDDRPGICESYQAIEGHDGLPDCVLMAKPPWTKIYGNV
jgi:hypothetical protein